MPDEGAESRVELLKAFVTELKKAKGKTLNDLDDVMSNQTPTLTRIGGVDEEAIWESFNDFSDSMVYARDPAKPDSHYVDDFIKNMEEYVLDSIASLEKLPPQPGVAQQGSTRPYRKKFDRCIKTVRKTVKARKGSNKESAAIAICTKSVLQKRGRTMKKYRKGKLATQKLKNI